MTDEKSTARNSIVVPEQPDDADGHDDELEDELTRFAHRLAGFGLGEALDAVLSRRSRKQAPG
jgi:hypothetical protein